MAGNANLPSPLPTRGWQRRRDCANAGTDCRCADGWIGVDGGLRADHQSTHVEAGQVSRILRENEPGRPDANDCVERFALGEAFALRGLLFLDMPCQKPHGYWLTSMHVRNSALEGHPGLIVLENVDAAKRS